MRNPLQISDTPQTINRDLWEAPNLTDRFDDQELARLGSLVWEGYQRDEFSRAPWMNRNSAGMDLAMQISRAKNFPWPGCANVIFPLITVAALQFSSRAYSNIVQGNDVVQYRVPGEDPQGELTAIGGRIGRHMSWQVLEEDMGWEEQHDRLFINLSVVGTSFVKTFYSGRLGHNVSQLILARDLVMDYFATSVEDCVRKTQLEQMHRNEVYEKVKEGLFGDILSDAWFTSNAQIDVSPAQSEHNSRLGLVPPQTDADTPFQFLQQHRLLDLDHDGYAEPYIVVIERNSKRVVQIAARWDREEAIEHTMTGREILRIRPTEYYTKYSFIPALDGGIYDIGFGTLIGPINEAVNSGINQLLDSGTMQNSLGGFLGRGAKIRGGQYTMAPWEWKRVDSTGDDLRKSLVPYPERQPATVTFQLLGLLINYVERLASTTEIMTGGNPGQNTPAYNMQAMLQQGMQVYNSIFKRIWRGTKEEFKKLHALNALYLPQRVNFGAKGQFILREDYKTNADQVVPVADPNLASDAEKMQKAQALRQASRETPGYNTVAVERNFLKAMRIDGVEVFYPGPDKVPAPPDPRVQAEQIKAQDKERERQFKREEWMASLEEERRMNRAQIAKIEAEIAVMLSDANVAQEAQKVAAFEARVEALNRHNELINERISMLMGGSGDESGNGTQAGGVPGMAGSSGDQGVSGGAPRVGEGAGAAMGGGEVSE